MFYNSLKKDIKSNKCYYKFLIYKNYLSNFSREFL